MTLTEGILIGIDLQEYFQIKNGVAILPISESSVRKVSPESFEFNGVYMKEFKTYGNHFLAGYIKESNTLLLTELK